MIQNHIIHRFVSFSSRYIVLIILNFLSALIVDQFRVYCLLFISFVGCPAFVSFFIFGGRTLSFSALALALLPLPNKLQPFVSTMKRNHFKHTGASTTERHPFLNANCVASCPI